MSRPITLQAGDSWSVDYAFTQRLTLQEVEEASSFDERVNERRPTNGSAIDGLAAEAEQVIAKNSVLGTGNYRLVVAVLGDDDRLLAVRGQEFTLFDSVLRTLRPNRMRLKAALQQDEMPFAQAAARYRIVPARPLVTPSPRGCTGRTRRFGEA